jgi:hypothetical protein
MAGSSGKARYIGIARSKTLELKPKPLLTYFRRTVMQTIKDLPRNEEMDSDDMAATQGGRMRIPGLYRQQVALPVAIDPVGPWNDIFDGSE